MMQFMAKKWDDQPEGRWTFIFNSLRKLATLYSVAGNVFKDSLLSYRDFKQLSDSLIPALEALIAGNSSEAHSARGQLRLIRICQSLATESRGRGLRRYHGHGFGVRRNCNVYLLFECGQPGQGPGPASGPGPRAQQEKMCRMGFSKSHGGPG